VPDRTRQFGLYGAQGEKGSQAAARVLDRLALEGGIASPVTSKRGLRARLRYLDSGPGRRAIEAAGITVTPRTLTRWQQGRQRPNPANLARLDAAYQAHRRHNVARHLLARLNARGGTRVEIHPLDQSAVAEPRRRTLEFRRLRIRRWDAIVAAWQVGDDAALADAWDDAMTDLGSDWGKVEWVTSVGFAA
jgi:hypothetical protein